MQLNMPVVFYFKLVTDVFRLKGFLVQVRDVVHGPLVPMSILQNPVDMKVQG